MQGVCDTSEDKGAAGLEELERFEGRALAPAT